MLGNLNPQQFTAAPTSTNSSDTSANGQGTARSTSSSSAGGSKAQGTQTVISIKGSAPSISTRA